MHSSFHFQNTIKEFKNHPWKTVFLTPCKEILKSVGLSLSLSYIALCLMTINGHEIYFVFFFSLFQSVEILELIGLWCNLQLFDGCNFLLTPWSCSYHPSWSWSSFNQPIRNQIQFLMTNHRPGNQLFSHPCTTQLQCPPSSGGMAAQSNKVWVCLTSVRSMLTKSLLMCIIFSFPFPVYVARSTQNENSKYSFFLTCHFRNWDMKKLVNILNVCDYLVKLYFYIN